VKVIHDLKYVRDGEVVLYKKSPNRFWQCRFKLPNAKWHRCSTKHTNFDYAVKTATEIYDESRFLHKYNLPLQSKRFQHVAELAIKDMQRELEAGIGKSVYHTYISSIRTHLIPYFAKKTIDKITVLDLRNFKANQSQKFNRPLKTSTITNYNASLNRIFDIAISKDWMSKSQVPPLSNKGVKGERRPAFSVHEWIVMMRALRTWQSMGHTTVTRNMRELLRDYVLILTNTGMRYGTESQNIKWKHITWFEDKDSIRYLMIAVDGKTGRRELIARHNVLVYLKRIQSRFADLNSMTFDELLEAKLDVHVFRLRNGLQTNNLNQSFEQFLKFVGLLKDKFGDNRTLYSLRHTYATMTLMRGQVGIHDLARQMGTSVVMIEKHYSHLNSAMKAKNFG
jgi:integrase